MAFYLHRDTPRGRNWYTIQFSPRFARTGRVCYIQYHTFFLRASRGREGCMYMYIPFKGARGIGRRTGCFKTVRGRIEGNREEKRLLYSITLQYIIMRSRNRERYLAYGAWKGGAWGIGRRSSQNHACIHFSFHVRQNHFYSHLLWYVHQNHAHFHLLLHARQNHFYSHLLPSQISSYRGFERNITIKNIPDLESPFRSRLDLASSPYSDRVAGLIWLLHPIRTV